MWRIAVRPRWIAALILALAVAAAFAALGQWQLERSIATGEVVDRTTETVVPLESVAEPQSPVTEAGAGQLVETTGSFVPGDFAVLTNRLNAGETGYWLVGHFVADGTGLAVAVGWAPTESEASAAIESFEVQTFAATTITGRYLPSEAPQETDFESGELHTLSTAALINLWAEADPAGVYGGYLVSADAVAGLDLIDSPMPSTDVVINWLNIFYAAEWAIFAGFAVFLWYRLVKDAWEREVSVSPN